MSADITLNEHQMSVNIDLKILKVQLNFKLKWRFHLRQIEAKLINKYNATNMIENFIWNMSLTINRHKYIVIEKLTIVHGVVVWYTSFEIKNNWKEVVFKLKTIQKRILQRIVDVYKMTTTKILKIKTHVLLINIYLENLLQSSIININIKRLISVVDTTIKYIRKDLMSKKKLKLRMISL